LLRWLIGWHLLYEGLVKLTNPSWSAKAYLASADGLFPGLFHSLAETEGLLRVVDYVNMWGLTIIGFSLLIGIFTTQFAYFGANGKWLVEPGVIELMIGPDSTVLTNNVRVALVLPSGFWTWTL